MRKIDIINTCILLVCMFFANSCNNGSKTRAKIDIMTSSETETFPESWVGEWRGTLDIFNTKGRLYELPMTLEIAQKDSLLYDWIITYLKDGVDDIRKYELVVKDYEANHYQIDEKNGIIIDAFYLGQELSTIYEVMGNVVNLRYRKKPNAIEFDLTMHKNKEFSSTGDTITQGDTIPHVSNFRISNSQLAILKKIE